MWPAESNSQPHIGKEGSYSSFTDKDDSDSAGLRHGNDTFVYNETDLLHLYYHWVPGRDRYQSLQASKTDCNDRFLVVSKCIQQ